MAKNEPRDELLNHDFDGIQEYDNQLPGWWKNLFYLTIVFAFIYLLYFHVFSVGDLQKVSYLKEIDPDYVPSPQDREGAVFDAYRAPVYAAAEQQTPFDRAQAKTAAYRRFEQNMLEAMRDASAAQLARLEEDFPEIFAAYTAQGGTLPAGVVAAAADAATISEPITDASILAGAKDLFGQHCATCHGDAGQGGIGPNLTDEYWLHGAKIANVVRVLQKGVPAKGMIAWEKTLSPDEINAMASFVLVELQGSNPPNPKAPEGDRVSE